MTHVRLPGPARSTPPLRPDAVRRTVVLDMAWQHASDATRSTADGVALHLSGTVSDRGPGSGRSASCRAGLAPDNRLLHLESTPADARLQVLLGLPVVAGFRARAQATLPEQAHTPLRALLDELPAAALVARYAVQRTAALLEAQQDPSGLAMGARSQPRPEVAAVILERMTDLCSGWREGGIAVTSMRRSAVLPLQDCPPAPDLDGADPEGWQCVGPVPPTAMRRRQRLDVTPDGSGGASVEGMFRDSYGDPDGGEVVLHEYALSAVLDDRGHLHDVVAEPRVLPFEECPLAAASAAALAGRPAEQAGGGLRQQVLGNTGCTHLTDMLRGLAATPALLSGEAAGSPCPR